METPKFEKLEDTPKKNEKGQVAPTPEEMDQALQWLIDHPEKTQEGGPRECTQEIAEFQDMVAVFEATYSLEALSAITDLTSDPDRKHPLRDPAKEALKPIIASLNVLKSETNISSEKYEELKKQWKILSNAVGMINNGIVDHNRNIIE